MVGFVSSLVCDWSLIGLRLVTDWSLVGRFLPGLSLVSGCVSSWFMGFAFLFDGSLNDLRFVLDWSPIGLLLVSVGCLGL